MKQVTFVVTRKDLGAEGDDRIEVSSFEGDASFYRVTYHTPEFRHKKSFVATESHVMNYLEDVLFSLSRDTEPFERLQLNTCIHPPVMYHVADLYEEEVRRLVLNMSGDALRFNVSNA